MDQNPYSYKDNGWSWSETPLPQEPPERRWVHHPEEQRSQTKPSSTPSRVQPRHDLALVSMLALYTGCCGSPLRPLNKSGPQYYPAALGVSFSASFVATTLFLRCNGAPPRGNILDPFVYFHALLIYRTSKTNAFIWFCFEKRILELAKKVY